MKHSIALFIAVSIGLVSIGKVSVSHATTVSVNANVERTLVADRDLWGGCMAKLDRTLADFGLNCPDKWVSFSCSGTFATKDIAYRMFDSAQMAFALEKPVMVRVDDTKKHNGFCYARRIDVLK